MRRLALFPYVCLIPLTFPFLGMEGIKVTLRMAWRAIRRAAACRSRRSPPRRPSCTPRAAERLYTVAA
jgi:hypothetical protein